MQNIITSVLACTLLLASQQMLAQQILNPRFDTARWEYKQIENRVKSETVTLRGHFISYGGQTFLWVQEGVDRQYVFKTKSVTGDWRDSRRSGELNYRVTCNGEEGTLRLVRKSANLMVELDFVQPNKSTPHLVLIITSINKI
jgi:hypothetical protein